MGGREIFHYVLFYSFNFCTSAEKIFLIQLPLSSFPFPIFVWGGGQDVGPVMEKQLSEDGSEKGITDMEMGKASVNPVVLGESVWANGIW